jgi:catechol 2,3-dioxygenase-like lactoylglutathione lyase family enzyme
MEISAFNHVGLTVSDLGRSLAFYKDMFGLEPEFIAHGDGAELSRAVGVPGTVLRFAFLRVNDAVVELLEYKDVGDKTFGRRNCDVGSAHVCIDVPDIQEAYRELSGKGVEFLAEPLHINEGPLAGCSFAYFRDPDGITLEIFENRRGAS